MRPLLLAALAALALAAPARADTLTVVGAGSLTDAFTELVRRFPAGPDTVAAPRFLSSGLMREKIEAGMPADVFASADMDNARRLGVGHPERPVIAFTRNRLCVLARPAVALTPETLVDRLLDPGVRVATSTPGADPGGDYAFAFFAAVEGVRPGARAILEAKALRLVGNGDKTPPLVPGKGATQGVFLADEADAMLGYCSGVAGVRRDVPDLVALPLPDGLAPRPIYGMVVLTDKPVAARFAAFVMSEAGQRVLAAHGFDPVAVAPDAPSAPVSLIAQRAGKPSRALDVGALEALPQVSGPVTIVADGKPGTATWSGPLLWDVVVAGGLLDPKEKGALAHVVKVTGADGYAVAFSVGELSPDLVARPIRLATRMDGAPLASLRLVAPDEKRAARSVRDVARVDVE